MKGRYLFDASSLLNITRELGEKVIDVVKNNFTISLAYYEIGNALWKECRLLRKLDLNSAIKTLRFMFSMFSKMTVIGIEEGGLGNSILTNAFKYSITYYDASYLSVAKKLDAILVSDDKELIKIAKKLKVNGITSKELINLLYSKD